MDAQTQELDWIKAEEYLKEVKAGYIELLSIPNAYPFFGLAVIKQIENRFTLGERTQELYDEIMALE